MDSNSNNNEITLNDLIRSTNSTFAYLWNKKWIIIIVSVVFAGLFVLKESYKDPIYKADLTFSLSEEIGGGVGAIGSILGQFGLGGGKKTNFEKMIDFFRTSKIQSKVIFTNIKIEGKEDYIGNHIIELYNFDEEWKDSGLSLEDLKFKHSNIDSFNLLEQTIYKKVFYKIIGTGPTSAEGLLYADYNIVSEILFLTARSVNEELSIQLAEKSFELLCSYYVQSSIKKHKYTFDILSNKQDSIDNKLKYLDRQIAEFMDSNRGNIFNTSTLNRKIAEREKGKLIIMLGEITKNLEIADFALKSNTPIISIIDRPLRPIYPIAPSLIISTLKGILLGGFLCVVFLIMRRIYIINK